MKQSRFFPYLACVFNMSNNLRELLKSSSSLLLVYPMLVAIPEAVGDSIKP